MAGSPNSSLKLNNTLKEISTLLRASNINMWFIGYGTLLGIIREDSCIDGDDDIDIHIDKNHCSELREMLKENNYSLFNVSPHASKSRDTSNIIKTTDTADRASIDFYMCDVNESGDFYDAWEDIIWRKCFNSMGLPLKKRWNNTTINIPFNSIEKLEARYGDWRTPRSGKIIGEPCRDLP